MSNAEVNYQVDKFYRQAVANAKRTFSSGWIALPAELRVLYIRSNVLGIVAGMDVEEMGQEARAKICLNLIALASKAMSEED